MKIFIMSDIHGSLPYLTEALDAFERESADIILILGDILYHGPRNPLPPGYDPKAVAERLNEYKEKIIAVRGNCDSEVDQMLLNFPIMGDYSTIFWKNRRIFATHGHRYSKENLPPLSCGDIFISGHTHIPEMDKEKNGIYILNPGSISIPKKETAHSYGILEKGYFKVKNLQGDLIMEKELD